jgi:cysteine desulfurase
MKKQIYLDNAATTKPDEKVIEAMNEFYSEKYGNASSQHKIGQEAKWGMEDARKVIAKSIGAKTSEIYFTSGGTEANNFAVKGLFFENAKKGTGKNHIITTKIEHDCVLNACKWLEKTQGAEVTYLDVDAEGFIDLEELRNAITEKTFLVSAIHGNNEIGTIQALEKIGEICAEKDVLLHTDACQSYTKVDIDVKKMNLSLVTLNGHKIHGPKGVGALYIKEGTEITTLAHGGGHERNLRSGTENVPGMVGFAKAVKIANDKDVKAMKELRDYLIEEILKIEKVKLNGPNGDLRLANNINFSFMNVEGEAIGGYLENEGIYVSTGSACMSHSLEPSHVLKAIGLTPIESNSSLRISISKFTTKEDIDYFLENLKKIIEKLRRISPF